MLRSTRSTSACGCRTSMPCTACTSTCCARSSSEIRRDAADTEDQRPDQHPGGHREPEEAPAHHATLTAAGEHLADHLPERHELQERSERRAAGRERPGWQALNIRVPGGHTERRKRRSSQQARVDSAAAAARVVNGGGEKHKPEERHPDALEDAQRAGLEALVELCVERVRDERRARDEAREIDETAVGSHAKRKPPVAT